MAIRTLIESLGVYLPSKFLSTEEVMAGCRNKPKIAIEEITGIKKRPVVGENEYAIDLAAGAVSKCFEVSRHNPEEIEMIISTNICRLNGPGHEFSYEPSTAAKIAAHLGIEDVTAFDISNACAGMFTGVHIMDSFIRTGRIKRGMVVSGEYISHLSDNAQKEIREPIDPQLASLTLGDSGAAVILEATGDSTVGFQDLDFFTVGRHCELCIGTITKEEHGGYVMYTDSVNAHKVAIVLSVEHTGSAIKSGAWRPSTKYHIIPHQTSNRALKNFSRVLNEWLGEEFCTDECLIMNVENRGNTSSTAHFVALWDFINNGTINSGEEILFVIQASGITVGMATYSLDDLPSRVRSVAQAAG